MSSRDTNLPHLDSDLLRTFLAVAKAGSISGGAARILRTQSAVSLQIQKLEDIVGQQLFERHGRGIALTAPGEELLLVARSVVETLDTTAAALRGLEDRTEIRLGVPEEYSDTVLPAILSAFSQEEPRARIQLRCGSSADFPRMLAAGDLDLVLHSPARTSESDIVVHRERAVWCGSDFHDVQNRRPLPVALFDKACWWRDRCLRILQTSGLDYQVVCTSENVAGIRASIAAGAAIGVLPQSAMTDRLRILPKAALPHIGQTDLVLTKAPDAPARLTQKLTKIIIGAFAQPHGS